MSKEPTGADLIALERIRQIKEEGWTPDHDQEHTASELVRAACAYALFSIPWRTMMTKAIEIWPDTWSTEWFRPSTKIRNLVKAGALIAAEIDRLHHLGEK